MNPQGDVLKSSYAFCRRFSRRSGSNFYLGFLLLPHDKRCAMDALYAFMRYTDDLVDALPSLDSDEIINSTTEHRQERLRHWRKTLEDAFTGAKDRITDPDRLSEGQIPGLDSNAASLLPALVDTVKRFRIPGDYLYAVLEGVEMDLHRRRYQTFEELHLYCQRVASAVGLACIHIWGFRGQGTTEGDAAYGPAWQAGIALQMTNILRDLKSDAAADRIYLPLADLQSCGYSVDELKNGVVNEAFYRLMAMEINRTGQLYREGYKLLNWLHPDSRPIFGLMMSTYQSLLEKIAHRPSDVFKRPIRLGKLQKFALFSRWALRPSAMINKLDKNIQSVK
jgi:15-cis-phytoene synthase